MLLWRRGPKWGHRIRSAFTGLWDKQSGTIEDEGVYTKDIVKRRMRKEVGREAGQGFQVGLDP